jgi:hypothetical protein
VEASTPPTEPQGDANSSLSFPSAGRSIFVSFFRARSESGLNPKRCGAGMSFDYCLVDKVRAVAIIWACVS